MRKSRGTGRASRREGIRPGKMECPTQPNFNSLLDFNPQPTPESAKCISRAIMRNVLCLRRHQCKDLCLIGRDPAKALCMVIYFLDSCFFANSTVPKKTA
jgi:hypothetical protein